MGLFSYFYHVHVTLYCLRRIQKCHVCLWSKHIIFLLLFFWYSFLRLCGVGEGSDRCLWFGLCLFHPRSWLSFFKQLSAYFKYVGSWFLLLLFFTSVIFNFYLRFCEFRFSVAEVAEEVPQEEVTPAKPALFGPEFVLKIQAQEVQNWLIINEMEILYSIDCMFMLIVKYCLNENGFEKPITG